MNCQICTSKTFSTSDPTFRIFYEECSECAEIDVLERGTIRNYFAIPKDVKETFDDTKELRTLKGLKYCKKLASVAFKTFK
jgi:hypothetical protein